MKTLTINGTVLVVLDAYPYQYPNGKRELRITLPQTAISYADLKERLKSCDGDITLTEEDGTAKSFVGYKTGVHLGGSLNSQRIFTFQNIPYAEQAKIMKKGLGLVPASDDDTVAERVVIPNI